MMSSALALALLVGSQSAVNPPSTPPRLRAGVITNDDYPADARAMRAEGTTQVSLQIGANGRVTGCAITGTSGCAALDSVSCRLAQERFRFQPAAANGQPVSSTYRMSIRWSLPVASPTEAGEAVQPVS